MLIRHPKNHMDMARLTQMLEEYPISKFYKMDPPDVIQSLITSIYSGSLKALVAFDANGDAVGFLLYRYNFYMKQCFFCDLYVKTGQRGSNTGISMVKHAMREALADGLTSGRMNVEGYAPNVWERIVGGRVTPVTEYIWEAE